MRMFSVIATGVCLALSGGLSTLGRSEGKGFTVVPWSLYQEALRWQVMAPGIEVPQAAYLLLCAGELTPEQLQRLAEAGYAVKGAAGRMVLVSAPITLYIDPINGLDALGFVSMVLPNIQLGVNPAPGDGLTAWLGGLDPSAIAGGYPGRCFPWFAERDELIPF